MNEFHFTPEELCKRLIALVPSSPEHVWYEPFRGGGNFYRNFPEGNPKDWSEIFDGRDFYENTETYDIICTNPPFKVDGKNSLIDIMTRLFSKARVSVNVLMNVSCFNGLTPHRLAKFAGMGWKVKQIHICNVKKWFGRYFFVRFTKEPDSFLTYDTIVY